jgi:beta-galactosidase
MLRKLLPVIALFVCFQISAQKKEYYLFSYFKGNGEDGLHLAYSADGLKWEALKDGKSFLTPTAGEAKLMRDPSVVQLPDGTFHMVWTCGWWEKQIGYASSKDLINWSEQKTIPLMESEPATRNCWAPELFYDDKSKKALIFWASTVSGKHKEIPTSEREKGLNHRIYYTSTSDFVTFEKSAMFFNPDFSAIDATILKKGKIFYMFVKNENSNPPEKNIRITTSKNALGPYNIEVSAPITGKYWAEGPTPIMVGEYCYVYFDKYTEHKYGAVRSKDMKNWEDVSDLVSFPQGIRHGTAFKVSEEVMNNLLNQK